jgi:hypothetical protein
MKTFRRAAEDWLLLYYGKAKMRISYLLLGDLGTRECKEVVKRKA